MTSIRIAVAGAAALLLAGCNSFMGEAADGAMEVQRNAPNRWTISLNRVDANDTLRPALYQAAIVTKANGLGWFQILEANDGVLGLGRGASWLIAGISDPNAPVPCTARSGYEWQCKPQAADAVIARVGPALNKTPEIIEQDLRVAGAQR